MKLPTRELMPSFFRKFIGDYGARIAASTSGSMTTSRHELGFDIEAGAVFFSSSNHSCAPVEIVQEDECVEELLELFNKYSEVEPEVGFDNPFTLEFEKLLVQAPVEVLTGLSRIVSAHLVPARQLSSLLEVVSSFSTQAADLIASRYFLLINALESDAHRVVDAAGDGLALHGGIPSIELLEDAAKTTTNRFLAEDLLLYKDELKSRISTIPTND